MKEIVHIVGARPNFMKLAPVYSSLNNYIDIHQTIIHTGQHYSFNMSDVFFNQLELPKPDINLEINGGTVLSQIGNGILRLESVLNEIKPNLVCLYGDINATAFGSITASKLGIKIAHIEAGLRSFDLSMPEETNRIITDSLSNYFFTPSIDANEHLINEGKSSENIYLVGNVMIDTLIKFLPNSLDTEIPFQLPESYILVTLHRPSNVDKIDNLKKIMYFLGNLSKRTHVIFPMHPRTRLLLSQIEFSIPENFLLTEPLDYFQFIKTQKNASLILTDSGGVQEESTFLGVPCFTIRDNTERPITITEGTNTLIGSDIHNLTKYLNEFYNGDVKKGNIPELWDGKAGSRIASIINEKIFTPND